MAQQWGSPLDNKPLNAARQKHFGPYKTINIGIGGDKTQHVLWRLDHGGVEGLQLRLVIVMIGNNNMFFTPETSIDAAAKGERAHPDTAPEAKPVGARRLRRLIALTPTGKGFAVAVRTLKRPEGRAPGAVKMRPGVQMCVTNVRDKFPKADIIAVKILPAQAPGNRFYEDIKKTNLALDPLKLDRVRRCKCPTSPATSTTPAAR